MFKPYKIDSPKIRLGPKEDGGYVVSLVSLYHSNALFTYGVGADVRFEIDYENKYKKPVYLFDHTIGQQTGADYGTMYFFNEGLGYGDRCKDFLDHWDNLLPKKMVLLKIDIEGGEYAYFEKTNIEKLASAATGILIELHMLSNNEIRIRAENILKKLSDYFTLTHIHGNNWGRLFDWGEIEFPDVVELTFVNNSLVGKKYLDRSLYPNPEFDFPNNPRVKDYDLSFLKNL